MYNVMFTTICIKAITIQEMMHNKLVFSSLIEIEARRIDLCNIVNLIPVPLQPNYSII